MKKYLTIICVLLSLTAFSSCGDNNSSNNSEMPESSISETVTETTTAVTTETTTEKETETTTQKQVYDLDSDIEFDNVSLSIPSFCEIKSKDENDTFAYLHISWQEDKKHEIMFHFYRDPERYKREKFDEDNIINTFTINGNEYMVDPDAYIPTTIFFTNEVASGRIHYKDKDEELVKQIIETIKFNTEKVETTIQNTSETTELNKQYTFGELSFKIPDNCEVTDNGDNITISFSDHSIIQIASTDTTKEICSSADSDKELLLDAILNSFMSGGSFEATSEYSKTDVKGFFAITQEATYLSLYDCTLYCFFSENSAYILTFAKSQLLEAKEAYDLQHEIINSFKFESVNTKESITTEETTEPVTETPTEKITEPLVIETVNSFETFTISGTGSTVIQDVNIPAEFVVYSAVHNGTSNFIAHFYDCNDKREPLVNEIGNYSCTQIFNATHIDDSSSGMVEVNADGDWSITFSPVKAVVSNETSTSFSGYGANITGAFLSTGNMVCTVSHDGSSNFIVHAYELSENGDKQPVANEIGEYNGQSIIRTKKDTLYFFNVDADGNWTINVE